MMIYLYATKVNRILHRQALNQVLLVPYTYSTQTMQSSACSGTRVFNTNPVNIRRCERFVTFKYRLKVQI